MPTGRLFARRAGPLGLALSAWDLWRRLPPKQRKQVLALALLAEDGPSDPVLLDQVRGRISLRGRRAPRPADVPQRDAGLTQRLFEPVPNRAPCAHVLRLLLGPHDFSQGGIGSEEPCVLLDRERIEQLEPSDCDLPGIRPLL